MISIAIHQQIYLSVESFSVIRQMIEINNNLPYPLLDSEVKIIQLLLMLSNEFAQRQ
jgi:hypothetical protein